MTNIQKQWFEYCENGKVNRIKVLIKQGFDINTQDDQGWTGAMLVASLEDQNILDFLIEAGADLTIKNNKNQTIYDIGQSVSLPNTSSSDITNTQDTSVQTTPTSTSTKDIQYVADSNTPSHWGKIRDERYDFKQGIEYIRNAFAESDYELYRQYIAVLNQVYSGFQKIANRNTPIKIAVSAETSAGKSTFLNALLFGEDVLEATFGETTKAVFEIAYGKKYGIIDQDGKKQECESVKEFVELVQTISHSTKFGQTDMIQIFMPSPLLSQGVILYDTPGYSSLNEDKLLDNILTCANQADIVIFIVDISRGIKKSDMEIYKKVLFIPEHAEHCYLILNKLDAISEQEEFEDMVFDGTNNEAQQLLEDDTTIQKHINKILEDMNKEVGLTFSRNNVIPLAARKFLSAPKSAYALLFKDFQDKINADIELNKNSLIAMRSDLPRTTAAKLINYIERSFKELKAKESSFFNQYFPNIDNDFKDFMEELMKDITTILNLDLYDKEKTMLRFAELEEVRDTNMTTVPFNVESVIWGKNYQLFKHIKNQWQDKVMSSNNQRQTLLHHSVSVGINNISELLLANGANTLAQDAQGSTPLSLAIAHKNEELIMEMCPRTAEFKMELLNDLLQLEFTKVTTWLVEKVSSDKMLLSETLCYAVEHFSQKHWELFFDALVKKGSPLNNPNKDGDTPIFIAVSKSNLELVKFLIASDVSVDSEHWKSTKRLLEVALESSKDIYDYLYAQGADIYFKTKSGQDFLITIYEKLGLETANTMLQRYATVTQKDQDLVRYFLHKGELEIVSQLAHLISDPKEFYRYAIEHKNRQITEILIAKKA